MYHFRSATKRKSYFVKDNLMYASDFICTFYLLIRESFPIQNWSLLSHFSQIVRNFFPNVREKVAPQSQIKSLYTQGWCFYKHINTSSIINCQSPLPVYEIILFRFSARDHYKKSFLLRSVSILGYHIYTLYANHVNIVKIYR